MHKIYSLALQNIRDLAVDRHESKEEFIVRCWLIAIGDVARIDFKLEQKKDIIIDPD